MILQYNYGTVLINMNRENRDKLFVEIYGVCVEHQFFNPVLSVGLSVVFLHVAKRMEPKYM